MSYLLDTNVLSEILRKRPAPEVLARFRATAPTDLKTSVVCTFELRYGAALHARGGKKTGLWRRISREILSLFTILPLDEAEACRAGEILADLKRRGELIGLEDVLIGATALENGLTVVTRNLRHFDRISGLSVESWWS